MTKTCATTIISHSYYHISNITFLILVGYLHCDNYIPKQITSHYILNQSSIFFLHILSSLIVYKLNSTSNKIVLSKKSHVRKIFLVTNHVGNSISFREITRKKLLPKKKYLAKKARGPYIAFFY